MNIKPWELYEMERKNGENGYEYSEEYWWQD
jgi:hypothetical protein